MAVYQLTLILDFQLEIALCVYQVYCLSQRRKTGMVLSDITCEQAGLNIDSSLMTKLTFARTSSHYDCFVNVL